MRVHVFLIAVAIMGSTAMVIGNRKRVSRQAPAWPPPTDCVCVAIHRCNADFTVNIVGDSLVDSKKLRSAACDNYLQVCCGKDQIRDRGPAPSPSTYSPLRNLSPRSSPALNQSTTHSPTNSLRIPDSHSPSLSTTENLSPSHSRTEDPSVSFSTNDNPSPSLRTTNSPTPSPTTNIISHNPSTSISTTDSPSLSTTDSPSRSLSTTDDPSPSLSTSDSPSPSLSTSDSPSPSLSTSYNLSPSLPTTDSPSQSRTNVTSHSPPRSMSTTDSPSPILSTTKSPSSSLSTTDSPTPTLSTTDSLPSSLSPTTDDPSPSLSTTGSSSSSLPSTTDNPSASLSNNSPSLSLPATTTNNPTPSQPTTNFISPNPSSSLSTTDGPSPSLSTTHSPSTTQSTSDSPSLSTTDIPSPSTSYTEDPDSLTNSSNTVTQDRYKSRGCGFRKDQRWYSKYESQNEASFGEFPWVIALLKDEGKLICGGSLIHPKVVLTGAHCVKGKQIETLVARAGEWDRGTTEEVFPHQDRKIEEVIEHEHYHSGALINDIALLILKEPMQLSFHVDTICLPTQDFNFDHSLCVASGWGRNKSNSTNDQELLKKVVMPIIPNEVCQETLRETRLGKYFELHDTFICAGGKEGEDTCKGDGGSPLVCPLKDDPDRYEQAGIVAWGVSCGNDIPGVYANVARFRIWINSELVERGISISDL